MGILEIPNNVQDVDMLYSHVYCGHFYTTAPKAKPIDCPENSLFSDVIVKCVENKKGMGSFYFCPSLCSGLRIAPSQG